METIDLDLILEEAKKAEAVFAEMIRQDIQAVYVGDEWQGYFDRKTGQQAETSLPPIRGVGIFWIGCLDQEFQKNNPGCDGYLHFLTDL